MKDLSKLFLCSLVCMGWGFFGHHTINRLAVFTLPPEMIGFYKKHIGTITASAVNPDRRRYSVADEAARHYIDIDAYGDSAFARLPKNWHDAVRAYGEDSLKAHGIVPWHIVSMYYQLRNAFLTRDPRRIIRISAELGHYVADAHVPLHTTSNYDGQKTGQIGIHALWESRIPELYSGEFDLMVGRAEYLTDIPDVVWNAVRNSNIAKDSVLTLERDLFGRRGEKKFGFETKGNQTIKVISASYALAYHRLLSGMVERRFRASIKMTGDLWYTAWVNAGQPDLNQLLMYEPSPEELRQNREEADRWKQRTVKAVEHE